MSNNFFIRTDANKNTGNGHLMRCLAFAQALRREGKKRRKAWCLICTLPPSNAKNFNLKTNLHLVFSL